MEKEKKRMHPVWFLVIGIAILIIPSAIYLGFLIPRMSEEYQILMASGGALGGAGMLGTEVIPEKVKYGTLYKTATKSFTLLVVLTLVKDFMGLLLGLAIVFVISYIIFKVMRGLYKDGKQRKQNEQLAKEVTRGIIEGAK